MMSTRPSRLPGRGKTGRWWAVLAVPLLGLFVTGCQTPIEGADDDRGPTHAGGLRHLGPQPPGRGRGRGPHRRAARRRRAAALGHPHRLDRPPGRRHRIPRRALRRLLARQPGGVHRRARAGAVRRGLRHPATRGPRHRDRPERHDHPCDPGSRRGAGPRRLARLHRPRQPGEHRRAAGHRRPGPGLPGADRRHHAHDQPRAGDEPSPPRRPAGRPTAPRGSWCCPPAPGCSRGRSWSSARRRRTCRRAATTSTPTPETWSTSGRCRRRSSRRWPTSGRAPHRTPTASRSPAPTRSDVTSRRSASRTATASS